MLGNLQMPELLLLLLVVVLLFGAKKLPDTARGLGRAMRIFKSETKGLRDDEDGEGDRRDDRRDDERPAARPAPQQIAPAEQAPGTGVPNSTGSTAPTAGAADREPDQR